MHRISKRQLLFAGAGALLLATVPAEPALALLVRPVLIDMRTTGSGRSATIEVVNDRNRAITVEVSVSRLAIPEQGPVVLTPGGADDFLIFPPQASIPAGARQNFRIQWVGDPAIPQTQLYMFETAELPVVITPGQSGIELYYSVKSVVAVSPLRARPNLSVVSVERGTDSAGRAGLRFMFANDGPALGYVTQSTLDITAAGTPWRRQVQQAELNNVFGLGIIPPNAHRAMFMPAGDVPATGQLTARLTALP